MLGILVLFVLTCYLFVHSFFRYFLEVYYLPGTMFCPGSREKNNAGCLPKCHSTLTHSYWFNSLLGDFFSTFILSSVSLSLSLPLIHVPNLIGDDFLVVGHLTSCLAFMVLMVFLCWAFNISSSILNSNFPLLTFSWQVKKSSVNVPY